LPRRGRALRPGRLERRAGRSEGRLPGLPAGDRAGPLHGRRVRRAAAHCHPGGGKTRRAPGRRRCGHECAAASGALRGLARRCQPQPARRRGHHRFRRGGPDLRERRRAWPEAAAAGRDRAGRRAAGGGRRRLRFRDVQHLQPARAAARGDPGVSAVQFSRDAVDAFRFVRCGFDPATGVAELAYAFDDGPELVERVTVPGAPFELTGERADAAQRALRLLHLIAGVSYYKAAAPGTIRIDAYAIDAATAELLDDLYLHGLGEFAYCNGLDLHGRIRFPREAGAPAAAPAAGLREHALVAIGGGKDSLVSIEALRAAGVAQTVAWVGGSQLISACAAR